MAGSGGYSSVAPPRPNSPPECPDLNGKRRELAMVQMLEKEISFLEGELNFVEGLQPAYRCCKEVADFVVANSDPFVPINQKISRPCRFWKWLCGVPYFNLSSICCFGCTPQLEMPHCVNCNLCSCHSCYVCSIPKCRGWCSWPRSQCLDKISCSEKCYFLQCPFFPDCSCEWRCSCPECPKVNLCCCCKCPKEIGVTLELGVI